MLEWDEVKFTFMNLRQGLHNDRLRNIAGESHIHTLAFAVAHASPVMVSYCLQKLIEPKL